MFCTAKVSDNLARNNDRTPNTKLIYTKLQRYKYCIFDTKLNVRLRLTSVDTEYDLVSGCKNELVFNF